MSLLSELLDQVPVPTPNVRAPLAPRLIKSADVVTLATKRSKAALSSPHSSAATATPEWRKARDGYINHLMACRSCYAPTGHYCQRGAELRATYEATPMETQQ